MMIIGRYTNAAHTLAAITINGVEHSGVRFDGAGQPSNGGDIAGKVKAMISAGDTISAFVPEAEQTTDQIYDAVILQQKVLKAIVLALNDGTLPVGTNKTPAQLKTIIKAKM